MGPKLGNNLNLDALVLGLLHRSGYSESFNTLLRESQNPDIKSANVEFRQGHRRDFVIDSELCGRKLEEIVSLYHEIAIQPSYYDTQGNESTQSGAASTSSDGHRTTTTTMVPSVITSFCHKLETLTTEFRFMMNVAKQNRISSHQLWGKRAVNLSTTSINNNSSGNRRTTTADVPLPPAPPPPQPAAIGIVHKSPSTSIIRNKGPSSSNSNSTRENLLLGKNEPKVVIASSYSSNYSVVESSRTKTRTTMEGFIPQPSSSLPSSGGAGSRKRKLQPCRKAKDTSGIQSSFSTTTSQQQHQQQQGGQGAVKSGSTMVGGMPDVQQLVKAINRTRGRPQDQQQQAAASGINSAAAGGGRDWTSNVTTAEPEEEDEPDFAAGLNDMNLQDFFLDFANLQHRIPTPPPPQHHFTADHQPVIEDAEVQEILRSLENDPEIMGLPFHSFPSTSASAACLNARKSSHEQHGAYQQQNPQQIQIETAAEADEHESQTAFHSDSVGRSLETPKPTTTHNLPGFEPISPVDDANEASRGAGQGADDSEIVIEEQQSTSTIPSPASSCATARKESATTSIESATSATPSDSVTGNTHRHPEEINSSSRNQGEENGRIISSPSSSVLSLTKNSSNPTRKLRLQAEIELQENQEKPKEKSTEKSPFSTETTRTLSPSFKKPRKAGEVTVVTTPDEVVIPTRTEEPPSNSSVSLERAIGPPISLEGGRAEQSKKKDRSTIHKDAAAKIRSSGKSSTTSEGSSKQASSSAEKSDRSKNRDSGGSGNTTNKSDHPSTKDKEKRERSTTEHHHATAIKEREKRKVASSDTVTEKQRTPPTTTTTTTAESLTVRDTNNRREEQQRSYSRDRDNITTKGREKNHKSSSSTDYQRGREAKEKNHKSSITSMDSSGSGHTSTSSTHKSNKGGDQEKRKGEKREGGKSLAPSSTSSKNKDRGDKEGNKRQKSADSHRSSSVKRDESRHSKSTVKPSSSEKPPKSDSESSSEFQQQKKQLKSSSRLNEKEYISKERERLKAYADPNAGSTSSSSSSSSSYSASAGASPSVSVSVVSLSLSSDSYPPPISGGGKDETRPAKHRSAAPEDRQQESKDRPSASASLKSPAGRVDDASAVKNRPNMSKADRRRAELASLMKKRRARQGDQTPPKARENADAKERLMAHINRAKQVPFATGNHWKVGNRLTEAMELRNELIHSGALTVNTELDGGGNYHRIKSSTSPASSLTSPPLSNTSSSTTVNAPHHRTPRQPSPCIPSMTPSPCFKTPSAAPLNDSFDDEEENDYRQHPVSASPSNPDFGRSESKKKQRSRHDLVTADRLEHVSRKLELHVGDGKHAVISSRSSSSTASRKDHHEVSTVSNSKLAGQIDAGASGEHHEDDSDDDDDDERPKTPGAFHEDDDGEDEFHATEEAVGIHQDDFISSSVQSSSIDSKAFSSSSAGEQSHGPPADWSSSKMNKILTDEHQGGQQDSAGDNENNRCWTFTSDDAIAAVPAIASPPPIIPSTEQGNEDDDTGWSSFSLTTHMDKNENQPIRKQEENNDADNDDMDLDLDYDETGLESSSFDASDHYQRNVPIHKELRVDVAVASSKFPRIENTKTTTNTLQAAAAVVESKSQKQILLAAAASTGDGDDARRKYPQPSPTRSQKEKPFPTATSTESTTLTSTLLQPGTQALKSFKIPKKKATIVESTQQSSDSSERREHDHELIDLVSPVGSDQSDTNATDTKHCPSTSFSSGRLKEDNRPKSSNKVAINDSPYSFTSAKSAESYHRSHHKDNRDSSSRHKPSKKRKKKDRDRSPSSSSNKKDGSSSSSTRKEWTDRGHQKSSGGHRMKSDTPNTTTAETRDQERHHKLKYVIDKMHIS